jgi:dihydrodipicolinate synthase/N-acetylneuraminate lyase
VKAAMAKLGKCEDELRLPLVPMQDGPRQKMYAIMRELGLIA